MTATATDDLEQAAAALERAPASDIVCWAVERHGAGLVLTASFQDCVLIDVAVAVAPSIEVVFLDTQYHFPETLAYVEEVRRRYDLNLRVVRPAVEADGCWRTDVDACCEARKVAPLARALEGRTAWMTGVRRAESLTRAGTPAVAWDARRRLEKINPLADWSDAEVDAYVAARQLPCHPLAAVGFRSIGCWPCTRPTRPGEDPRAGRWAGTGKTECGLHP